MANGVSMLEVIEQTSKSVRNGPIELRRAVEVAEAKRREAQREHASEVRLHRSSR